MKIALLSTGISPHVVGGMQKHSFYLAKYLAQQGIGVDLYHTVPGKAQPPEITEFSDDEMQFIEPIFIPYPRVRYFPGHYLAASYLYSKKIQEAFNQRPDVDFIYVQGFAGWALMKSKRAGSKRPTAAINMHGLEMYQRAPSFKARLEQQMFKPATGVNLRAADIVFSLGGKLTGIIKRAGVPPTRIIEMPIGISSDWLRDGAAPAAGEGKPRRFIFVGRFERRKGIEELYAVLNELLPVKNFEFHFIGPIPESLQVASPRVKYWGLVKESASIQQILSECDVLVCPSHAEGMPTVILEAMASGLATIATDVGAVAEVVSSENGWLIPAGDSAALKRAISEAVDIAESDLREKQRKAMALISEKFTWERVIQRTITEIQMVVQKLPAKGS